MSLLFFIKGLIRVCLSTCVSTDLYKKKSIIRVLYNLRKGFPSRYRNLIL